MDFNWIPGSGIAQGVGGFIGDVFGKDVDLIPGFGVNEGQRSNAKKTSAPAATQPRTNMNDGTDAPIDGGIYSGSALGAGGRTLADIAADRAYLDDQQRRLEAQLASSNNALNNGLTSLQDSYNQELSKSNQNRSRVLEDFKLKTEDTERNKNAALNKNDTQARTLADSLRRRIGLASGSGSSAFQLAAPKAVANVASDGRSEVQENFGVNFRNLGLASKRADEDFTEQQRDLEAQRKSRESDFRSGILNNQNQIYTSLSELARSRAQLNGGGYEQVRSAMAPYTSQIDSRQAQIDGLFNQFRTPYNVKAVNVQAPQLRDYVTERAQIGQSAQPGSQTDPFAEALRKKQLEEQPLL